MTAEKSPSTTRVLPTQNTAKLCVHKATGQAYVNRLGRRIYLGRHDKPETIRAYHQLMAEWAINGGLAPVAEDCVLVKELIARFWIHAEQYYRLPSGEHSQELSNFRQALRPLREIYGESAVAGFGPRAMQAVRQRMIEIGWCRSNINKNVSRIKTLFRWGAEQELVPGEVHHALQAVAGLKKGRCAAPEAPPVRPVPIEAVNAIETHVSRQVWALIQLQLFTAARPGELLRLRPCDIDRSGEIWTFTPDEHKTAHHGHVRKIYFGPRAQRVLLPFLLRNPDAFCFSPREAEAARLAQLAAERRTPMSCGNRPGLNTKHKPQHEPGECYDVDSYRRAIERGCDAAFPPPEALARRVARKNRQGGDVLETTAQWMARLTDDQQRQLRKWRKAHRWHPHQLRHSAATELRKEFGLEVARVILGHRSAAITEIYAEMDAKKAVEIMARVG